MFALLSALLNCTRRVSNAQYTQTDRAFSMSHWYDIEIEEHLARFQCPPQFLRFNSSPTEDPAAGYQFDRNYRSLARRMLQHLDDIHLIDQFVDTPHVTIASLGCGLGMDVFPLLIYFAYHNKPCNYVGFDIDESCISQTQTAFSHLPNVRFVKQNALNSDAIKDILGCKANLIVSQHPNLLVQADVHSRILTETIPAIAAENAVLYIALYYAPEMALFNQDIRPALEEHFGALSTHVENGDRGAMYDRWLQLPYAPEKYYIHSTQQPR